MSSSSGIRLAAVYSGSSEWQRSGRGKSSVVFVTGELMAEWVAESIGDRAEELILVGVEKRRKADSSRFLTARWIGSVEDLLPVLVAGCGGQANRKEVYLCAPGDEPPESVDGDVLTRFALNGCPRLFWLDETVDEARLMLIGHVDAIVSTETGQVVHHEHYTELYERIRKTMMRRTVPARDQYSSTGWSGARVAKALLSDS